MIFPHSLCSQPASQAQALTAVRIQRPLLPIFTGFPNHLVARRWIDWGGYNGMFNREDQLPPLPMATTLSQAAMDFTKESYDIFDVLKGQGAVNDIIQPMLMRMIQVYSLQIVDIKDNFCSRTYHHDPVSSSVIYLSLEPLCSVDHILGNINSFDISSAFLTGPADELAVTTS
jgi:hypothetical protein